MFDFKPEHFSQTVSATRDFWIHVLKAKIEATVREEGDMIGWDDDEETVGPNALRAKQTLLEAVPRLLPEHNANVLYRLVLENGDFGIHNTSVSRDDQGKPLVTSLYDWEIACIVPAILAESLVAAGPIDLITNEYAQPAITRVLGSATVADIEGFEAWSEYYFKVSPLAMTVCSSADMAYDSDCTNTLQTSKSLLQMAKIYDICGSHCAIGVVVTPR